MSGWLAAYIAGAAVVLALAIYAGMLWQRVFAQRRARAKMLEFAAQKRQEWIESAVYLARVLLADQASHGELAIRIQVLLDNIYPNQCHSEQPQFAPFYDLSAALAHLPIREERAALDKKTRRAQDREREALELQFKPQLQQAAKALIAHEFGAPRYDS